MKTCLILLFCVAVTVNARSFGRLLKRIAVKNDPGMVNTNLRCHGKDNECCTADHPCDLHDGDCEYHYQCKRGLICGDNNCNFGPDKYDDCCKEPQTPAEQRIEAQHICKYPNGAYGRLATGDGEGYDEQKVGYVANAQECIDHCLSRRKGDYGINGMTISTSNYCYCEKVMTKVTYKSNYRTCFFPKPVFYSPYTTINGVPAPNVPYGVKNLRCQGAEDECCTEANPCDVGDGDCDNNDQCVGDLVCANDNCPWGKHGDCCMPREGAAGGGLVPLHLLGDEETEKLGEKKDEKAEFSKEEIKEEEINNA